ncbi:MAG: hypothetical protein KA714_14700 [Limnoraphis sp. WC205]|nr:hypothetical protein [Limnoraphis sp. WC205]
MLERAVELKQGLTIKQSLDARDQDSETGQPPGWQQKIKSNRVQIKDEIQPLLVGQTGGNAVSLSVGVQGEINKQLGLLFQG